MLESMMLHHVILQKPRRQLHHVVLESITHGANNQTWPTV